MKKELNEIKVDQVIIPGGCTKYVQAPDVCWNKPFKAKVTELYDQWLSDGVHQYTEAGNMKAPSRKKLVEWILEAWSSLSKESIINSFKCCGLNLESDWSEDGRTHFFKKGEPCEPGRELLKSQLSFLLQEDIPNPFASITDSDEEDAAEEINLIDLDGGSDEEDIQIV